MILYYFPIDRITVNSHSVKNVSETVGPRGVWGNWGEWLTAGEQAHGLGDLRSPAKK